MAGVVLKYNVWFSLLDSFSSTENTLMPKRDKDSFIVINFFTSFSTLNELDVSALSMQLWKTTAQKINHTLCRLCTRELAGNNPSTLILMVAFSHAVNTVFILKVVCSSVCVWNGLKIEKINLVQHFLTQKCWSSRTLSHSPTGWRAE